MKDKEEVENRRGNKLKKFIQFILNPKLLVCLVISWVITNGWSYIFVFLGTRLKIKWMLSVGSAYLAFLWLPFTPEKLVTIALAIILLRFLFPNDKKTLRVLKIWFGKIKNSLNKKKEDEK